MNGHGKTEVAEEQAQAIMMAEWGQWGQSLQEFYVRRIWAGKSKEEIHSEFEASIAGRGNKIVFPYGHCMDPSSVRYRSYMKKAVKMGLMVRLA